MQQDVRVRSTAQIASHPMLVPIPIACFIGALLTDIAYVVSAEMKAIVPVYALSPRAPLGMAFNTSTNLPAAYRGGAFVGEHGSWNRQVLNGYKVVFVPFADGKRSGPAQDVVTGFLNSDNQARGRPVGVAIDKTGALLVADDSGNTVRRVTAAHPEVTQR
ncbi:glucose/arabinose dehydrogenase [Bradyrhizobium japonicum]|nr:glucose/arabinose dehydrogenase [Bradyrhizobium japonicum]